VAKNGEDKRRGVYVFTSPGPGEGKSLTVTNFAMSIASTGQRVLLIDADLRRPKLHEILSLENRGNLAKLLATPPSELHLSESGNGVHDLPELLTEAVQTTDIPNLQVITSGPLPEVPAEVLHSEYLPDWIKMFRSYYHVDVILFDTPPCLVVSDSAILASNLHARVVLVIEAGHTQREAAMKARDQFMHIGSPLSGIVLNKANRNEPSFSYGYYDKAKV
jgi:capsular exopolysaccharide synthesis family protein